MGNGYARQALTNCGRCRHSNSPYHSREATLLIWNQSLTQSLIQTLFLWARGPLQFPAVGWVPAAGHETITIVVSRAIMCSRVAISVVRSNVLHIFRDTTV